MGALKLKWIDGRSADLADLADLVKGATTGQELA